MDVDLDLAFPEAVKKIFGDKLILASRVEKGELLKHPVGIYLQTIPKDSETGLAAIPCMISGEEFARDRAQERGYYKFDFLHVNILKHFQSKQQMREILKLEPDWDMLEDERIVKQLFHIHNHFDIVYRVRPRSLDQLADILQLIRPGKIKLLDKYLNNPEIIRKELFIKRDRGDLRRSHAIPYSMLIILNMHIIKREMSNEVTAGNN